MIVYSISDILYLKLDVIYQTAGWIKVRQLYDIKERIIASCNVEILAFDQRANMALYNSLHMHFYKLFLHTDSKYTHHKPSNEVVTFIYMK